MLKNLVVAIILLYSASTALAAGPLTLTECQVLAEKKNSNLKIQAERRYQAEQRLKQSQGDMMPDFRYEFGHNRQNSLSDTPKYTTSKFTLSQPLFYGLKKVETVSLSRSAVRQQELLYDAARRNLKADISQAFYTLAQLEIDLKDIQDSYNLLQDRLKELNERVQLGKSRESEVLVVQSQMGVLLAQEESAENDRQAALETLSLLTGVKAEELAIIDDNPATVTVDPVEKYQEAAKNRPDLEALRQEIISQNYQVKIARGDYWPAVNLDGSWYTGNSDRPENVTWQAAISLDFPLFQGGISVARVNEELSLLRAANETLVQFTDQVNTDIRKLYKALLSSVAQAETLKGAYAKAEKSYQLQLKDYRYGLVNNLDVLQSLTTLLDGKRNLDRALMQVKINKALLDIAAMQEVVK
jgi:outer membrane protein